MSIKHYIPNAITSMNLFCGVLATTFALNGELKMATIFIFMGAFFDFFDGFTARMLKVSSSIGKELDSLSDLISFGFAPAAMYSTYIKYLLVEDYSYNIASGNGLFLFWTLSPFILVVFSALRLAKFNLDTRQTENFLGLTTTATGLLSASLLWTASDNIEWFSTWFRPSIVLMTIFIFCALLVSELPMFSLKIKHWTWTGNELRFILVFVAIVSIILVGVGGIACTILLYILFSIGRFAFNKNNQQE